MQDAPPPSASAARSALIIEIAGEAVLLVVVTAFFAFVIAESTGLIGAGPWPLGAALTPWISVGIGIPFLIVGAFTGQATEFINRHALGLKYLNVIFGVILLGLGILIFTQKLALIANFEFLTNILSK